MFSLFRAEILETGHYTEWSAYSTTQSSVRVTISVNYNISEIPPPSIALKETKKNTETAEQHGVDYELWYTTISKHPKRKSLQVQIVTQLESTVSTRNRFDVLNKMLSTIEH